MTNCHEFLLELRSDGKAPELPIHLGTDMESLAYTHDAFIVGGAEHLAKTKRAFRQQCQKVFPTLLCS